jgi:hypothetical protein
MIRFFMAGILSAEGGKAPSADAVLAGANRVVRLAQGGYGRTALVLAGKLAYV